MIGRTVAHYEIQSRLGSGAMGEVYLARDTQLRRQVALKFLPETLSDDADARARLLHEAQNASLLNHPNVVTIHAIEHADGRDFIVMEYIEGQTLSAMLAEGPLPAERIVEIGRAICAGLEAAHAHGIIHRDIKPDNIFVTSHGHVKIADFGIARSQESAGLTKTGMTPGTAYYMSPEQARGEKTLDGRSDLFSTGAVLYEMATGRRPFEGEHLTAVLFELLSETPPKPSTLRADLPAGFDEFIDVALAKSPDARYPDAAHMAQALQALVGGAPPLVRPAPARFTKRMRFGIALTLLAIIAIVTVGYITFSKYFAVVEKGARVKRKTLAVLPFENIGPADQEYFADGLTDEIIAKLNTVGGLGVISRTSVLKYKDARKSNREIGDDLGVEYVIEGAVRWDPTSPDKRVRVTTRLVVARDDVPLWNQTYDTLLSDILAIQADIAERVSGALHITLLESERQNLARGGTRNVDALLAYYRGLEHFHAGNNIEDIREAIRLYTEAVEHDSTYLQAWARLSRSHSKMVWYGPDPLKHHADSARKAAEWAARLDPSSPDAKLARGYVDYWVAKDNARALATFTELEQSGIKSSELYDVYTFIAYVQRRRGEFERAIDYLQIALTEDPDRPVKDLAPRFAERAWEIGNTYLRMRRWSEAEPFLRLAVQLAPAEATPYRLLARMFVHGQGNLDSALAVLLNVPSAVNPEQLAEERVTVCLLRRDPVCARRYLQIADDDTAFYNILRAQTAALEGNNAEERDAFAAAAADLRRQVDNEPNFAPLRRYLGIALAGAGRRDEALREGRRALESQPPEKDAFYHGPENVLGLARIHCRLGDAEEAITLLDSVLHLPAGLITPDCLKLSPEFDPLRGHPSFEALLSAGQPTAHREPSEQDPRRYTVVTP
jgi:TolB-like protein/predicted Ser/Thr protein kinase/Flp pilus assembly protein TadD